MTYFSEPNFILISKMSCHPPRARNANLSDFDKE